MKLFNSLRFKIMSMFIAVMIPLVVFLCYSNFYSMDVVRNQVAKTSNDLLALHITQVEQSMEDTRMSLWQMISDDISINTLLLYDHESIDYLLAVEEIRAKFASTFNYNNLMDTLFIYVERDDLVIPVVRGLAEINLLADKDEFLKENMKSLISYAQKTNYRNWQMVEMAGQKGLLMLLGDRQGLYIGTWVSMERLMKPLESLDIGEGVEITALSPSGEPVHAIKLNPQMLSLVQSTIREPGMEYKTITDPVKLEKYLIILKKSDVTNLSFVTVFPEKSLLMALPDLQRIIFIIPYLIVFVVIAYMVSLERVLLNPIKDLIKAMRNNAKGNLNAQVKERGANEFRFLIRTFNEMMEQIKDLKIDVYEERLHVQRAELKHLQAQINPHFFANSLNTVYNLAFLKDFKSIQKMARYLADYNRFVIRAGRSLIPLQEEMTHIRNYLEIQKYRFTDNLVFEIDIPEEYNTCLLPPLTLQPFVENSIIHGYNEKNELLKIQIAAYPDTDNTSKFYNICIKDNGVGFPHELLMELQSEEYINAGTDEHIGIWSVHRRISMYFGKSVEIRFENDMEKGALVWLRLPR